MQNPYYSMLRLHQLERSITRTNIPKPRAGWLRVIRESLGRSIRAQAALAGMAPSTLSRSEQSEAEDSISLSQLRKLAQDLDCELVYTLVPRKPLYETVEQRADVLARKEIQAVVQTMRISGRCLSEDFIERRVADRRQELLAGSWSRLWR